MEPNVVPLRRARVRRDRCSYNLYGWICRISCRGSTADSLVKSHHTDLSFGRDRPTDGV